MNQTANTFSKKDLSDLIGRRFNVIDFLTLKDVYGIRLRNTETGISYFVGIPFSKGKDADSITYGNPSYTVVGVQSNEPINLSNFAGDVLTLKVLTGVSVELNLSPSASMEGLFEGLFAQIRLTMANHISVAGGRHKNDSVLTYNFSAFDWKGQVVKPNVTDIEVWSFFDTGLKFDEISLLPQEPVLQAPTPVKPVKTVKVAPTVAAPKLQTRAAPAKANTVTKRRR